MKTFLVLYRKHRKNNNELKAKIDNFASAALSCLPASCKSSEWFSKSGRVALFAWSNEIINPVNPLNSAYSSEDNAITMTGYLNESFQDYAEKILYPPKSIESIRDIVKNTGGLYTLCYLNGNTDSIAVWNTITRIESAFWCENSNFIAVSNRAVLLNMLLNESLTPEYNLESIGQFIGTAGFYYNDSTPFKGINILKSNSQLVINKNGAAVSSIDNMEYFCTEDMPSEALYDDITEALINAFKPIKNSSIQLKVGITGGKDSRLIAAILKYIGADFTGFTTGFRENPDVIIGEKVAAALNIPYSVSIPNTVTEDNVSFISANPMKRTADVLYVTDGMMSGYENFIRRGNFIGDIALLGGNGGEILRGGYAKYVSAHKSDNVTAAFKRNIFKYKAFINDEIVSFFDNQMRDFTRLYKCESHISIAAKYFLIYDVGRWSAAARAGYTSNATVYQPFFDNMFVKMIQKFPTALCLNDYVIYNILKRINPELIDIPFYKQRWNFEKKQCIDGNIESWEKRAPLTAASIQSKGSFNWRMTCVTELKEEFYNQIFNSDSSSMIKELIKVEEVKKLFNNPELILKDGELNYFLWSIYSACILLSNAWIKNCQGNEISIKIK